MWQLARENGMSRRRFLQLLSAGGAAAVLAACVGESPLRSGDPAPAPTAASRSDTPGSSPAWFKDPAPFIQRSGSLETRLENLRGVTTPNRLFFVRNNSTSMDLDASAWRLSIEGDAVSNPLELTFADIQNMPSATLVSYLECAGNHRAMFDLVKGQKADGTQWERGAVGSAEWTGVPLRDLLARAGISQDAASVLLVGLDEESPEGGFREGDERREGDARRHPTGIRHERRDAAERSRTSRCAPSCPDGSAAPGSSGLGGS